MSDGLLYVFSAIIYTFLILSLSFGMAVGVIKGVGYGNCKRKPVKRIIDIYVMPAAISYDISCRATVEALKERDQ